jgi:beta-xylosidase
LNRIVLTYQNPVYPGDFPDPSIIRVGGDGFWATATSTEWAPQFPLLFSRDLVHWKHVTAVFKERPAWSVGKFWAPELSHHDGTFFVYYSAEHVDGGLCIGVATASSAQGPYSDRGPLVGQPSGSIDPTTITDDRGRRFLIWKEDGNSRQLPTTIWAQQLDASGTVLVGEAYEILRNDATWEGAVVEAPSLIRRDGWFYMFYSGNACCGKRCKYAVGVARSRSITSGWEKFSGNPIMAGNERWRCPGHGSVFDTQDGRTFYLYHAYCVRNSVYVGRQALLDEIVWNADGWPSMNGGNGPSTVADCPISLRSKKPALRYSTRFRGRVLPPTWQWPQERPPDVALGGLLRGGMTLSNRGDRRTDDVLASVLARPIRSCDFIAETGLDMRRLEPGTQAGLCFYGDADNAVGAGIRDGSVYVWRRSRGAHRSVRVVPIAGASAPELRIACADGRDISFFYRRDGLSRWIPLTDKALHAPHISPWDRGIRLALTVGGKLDASARFTHLNVMHEKRASAVASRVVR